MSNAKEQITYQMRQHGIPAHKAELKYRSTVVGVVLMVVGSVLALVSFALPLVMILALKDEPGLILVGFCGVGLLGGIYLGIVGGHRASGETMRAADEAGAGLFAGVAKLIRAWKGKNGGTG